ACALGISSQSWSPSLILFVIPLSEYVWPPLSELAQPFLLELE
ncbi:hypothetical protein SLEP1_g60417, partial [Rubroshorea leprosula]